MRILYISPEVTPFAKTGGLADVAGALSTALGRLGHEVKVLMPKYGVVDERRWGLKPWGEFKIRLAGKVLTFTLWSTRPAGSMVEYLFVGNERLFGRSGLYQQGGKDYPDNLHRFAAFSRAALDVPRHLAWCPDVIHANEWQTALTFSYFQAYATADAFYDKMGTLFTIHNLGYAGVFPGSEFEALGLPPDYFTHEKLEFYGLINLMKSGLVFADVLSTVSPTYSHEIQTPEFGFGMEGILQARRKDLFGILNGVDYDTWNPARDPHLLRAYDVRDLKGKNICKAALQERCGFAIADVPVIGMIARLTPQKGVDLVLEVIDELVRLDGQIVILGAGDPKIEKNLQAAAKRYSKKISVHLKFDEAMAHQIEAGADLLLLPSRYEPCGLNQLYSLRYGTIPVARKTGGLADTITDATPSNLASMKATGLFFEAPSGHSLLTTLRLALCLYQDRALWRRMMQTAMAADFSWDRSAREYVALYQRALKKNGRAK